MLPQLRRLADRFPQLVIVGVHCGKYPNERRDAQLRAALQRLGVEHPVVNDRTYRAWRAFGIFGWPTLVLLGPDGGVIHTKVGESTAEYWTPLLEPLLGDATAGQATAAGPGQMQRAVRFPAGVAARSGLVALADTGNHRILLGDVRADVFQVTQIIGSGQPGFDDGPAAVAAFNQPHGLAFAGDMLYVADTANHRVRAIDVRTGAVTTVLGTGARAPIGTRGGPGPATPIASPWSLAPHAGQLIVAMAGLHQLWHYDPGTGVADVLAGTGAELLEDGPLAAAAFAQPSGLAADERGLFVADSESQAIRHVQLEHDTVTTLVGTGLFDYADKDGVGDAVLLQHPQALAAHQGLLYVADTYNHKIKMLDPTTRACDSWLGRRRIPGYVDGAADEAAFDEPGALALLDDQLLIADTNNHALRAADIRTGAVRTIRIAGLDRLAHQENI